MSIFEKIAEDPKILEIYEKIEKKQKKEQETCHHGCSHISSVIDKTAFFMQLAGADEIQIEEAKIAALLHDTGLLVSEKNHDGEPEKVETDPESSAMWSRSSPA